MNAACRYERLDRWKGDAKWEPCAAEQVMEACCRIFRDAEGAFQLLNREGVVISDGWFHYRCVIQHPDEKGAWMPPE